jgi:hypothetical protein
MNPTLVKVKLECSACDTPIWQPGKVGYEHSSEYNEVTVKLNDLSKMKIGVCSKHTKPNKKDLTKMTSKTIEGWLEEIALGVGNKEWVTSVGTKLIIVGVA